MANRNNTFLIKRSNVAGNKPTAGQLLLGELALNTADAILYTSGTTASSILPIGWDRVHRTGDTMTGTLYVPTISATTYYNLPLDITVTGGTYDNPTGTASFVNNTGGTFSVTGFTTGSTSGGQTENFNWKFSTTTTSGDPSTTYFRANNSTPSGITQLYVSDICDQTGFDVSNIFSSITGNFSIYIQQTDDATKFMQFNTVTGYTDNTGWWTIPVSYVQSGSGGLFGNNSKCTFYFVNKNGSSSTDTYTTGFTYSNNLLTIKQNQGQPDLSVLINTMTGLTATTISATTIESSKVIIGGGNIGAYKLRVNGQAFFGDVNIDAQSNLIQAITYAQQQFTNSANSYIMGIRAGGGFTFTNVNGNANVFTLGSDATAGRMAILNNNVSFNPNGVGNVGIGWENGYTVPEKLTVVGNILSSSGFILSGGTSSQFLMANGSVSTGTTFNGGVVSGLTANTISATTYQNLPITTFNNGLTLTGSTAKLGGTLLTDTIVNINLKNIAFSQSPTFTGGTNGGIFGGKNQIVTGHDAVAIGGANSVVSGNGAVSCGTDGEAAGAYSFIANDANWSYGISSSSFGFGNYNYDENGFVVGNDNILGAISGVGTPDTYSSTFIAGTENRVIGSRSMAMGRAVAVTVSESIGIGAGVTATNNRMTISEAKSFGVGFNSTVPTFIVHQASGAGTYGQTEAAGTLKVGSISQDNSETKVVVWNSTDKVFEWRSADSIGGFTGGTVTGATNFTNGLTANTISATTYQNLPTDIRVTGGTYSSGTAIFTNNTGGTFNVVGFSTSFTGGTVTGATNFTNGLTANTISATTYLNLPTDIRVTGGTGNNATKIYTFTNNTGGTFNVTALTDIVVTGGTYSSGTAVFTNNTGGTFNVTGFSTGGGSFTGGTVTGATNFTGGLTANTISATTISSSTLTVSGVTFNKLLIEKVGFVAGASFTGTPRKATVSFATQFPDTNYAIVITGGANRGYTYESQTTSGFTINSNANTAISGNVYWIAKQFGEV